VSAVSGPVILITGASSGLGRACANALHTEGWTVVGASRRATGAGWQPLAMDVDDDVSVEEGVRAVLEEHGRIDAVLTAAGWGLSGPVETTPLTRAKAQLETNFWGTVRVVRQVLPHMRAAGKGHVLIMSSLGGLVGVPFQAYYSASKFALEGFGEALAYEVEPFGITVTLIEPGNAATGFTDNRQRSDPKPDDPYARANESAVAAMEEDERNGIPAQDVAAAVVRVLASGSRARRVPVGRVPERLGAFSKRLMPYRLFERLARGTLGLK
jgi:NAD(P)-dependent dehydrogenase (short-subunit alcohol dehydrogenase family)